MIKLIFRNLVLSGLLHISSIKGFSQDSQLCYDLNMSPYAGGQDLILGTKICELGSSRLEQSLFPSLQRNFLQVSYRFIEMAGLYLPLNYFTSIVQHEVFGHGYRIRDIGNNKASVRGYEFSWPPPYGNASATTRYVVNPSKITTTDLSSISLAGFEAQFILAQMTKIGWYCQGFVDPRQVVLFLASQFAISLYGSNLDLSGNVIDGHDLNNYVLFVNMTYTEGQLSVGYLKSLSLINFIDILNYISIHSWARFIISGEYSKIPMIKIGKFGYVFSSRIGLTPFGPEVFLDNYLMNDKTPYYFYVKAGNHAKNTYLGWGIFLNRLFSFDPYFLGLRMDGWHQPKLLNFQGKESLKALDLDEESEKISLYSQKEQHDMNFGSAISLIGSYEKNNHTGVQGEFGWKTKGFLPGYSLYNSPVVRISMNVRF